MGASAEQFQFAAEIIAFLAALAGLALLSLRTELLVGRRIAVGCLIAGFAGLAASAFLHGALIGGVDVGTAVVALRLLGAAGILAAAAPPRWWAAGPGSRRAVIPGAVLIAAAAAAHYGSVWLEESLVAVGALLVATSVVSASRRAIGARLAAAAAGTLLLIVVVLSASLSAVLAGTISNDALRRLDSRAAAQAVSTVNSSTTDLREAKLIAGTVEAQEDSARAAGAGQLSPAQLQQVVQTVATNFFSDVGVAWVGPDRVLQAAANFGSAALPMAVAQAAAASGLVGGSAQGGHPNPVHGVAVLAGHPVAVGVFPAQDGEGVAVTPLDSSYLRTQGNDDKTMRLFLTDGNRVLSSYPPQGVPSARVMADARAVMAGGHPASDKASDKLSIVRPVGGVNGAPAVALVADVPTGTAVDPTRNSLFHTLFLIALGGSLLAFVLSLLSSDRITRELAVLTSAARRISRGDTRARAGLRSDDEIGVLSRTFDAMASSVEEHSAALRRAADEEARLRSRLESVVAGMGEALIAVDKQGNVTEFNHAAERLLGVRRPEAVGRPVGEVVALTPDGDGRLSQLARPAELAGIVATEATVLGDGGRSVPVSVTFGPIGDGDGGAGGAVAVLRDLSREYEIERMKSEFLSRIGHELRTPLTGIVGFSEILARRDIPREQAQSWHREILDQGRRLQRTIEMLEFVASSGANRMVVDMAPTPVAPVVNDVLARWQAKVTTPHSLRASVEPDLPPVLADRRWLDLALDELVDNAIKFSPEGGPVTVAVSAGSSPDTVRISVTDAGPGMSDEQISAAFSEFVQGDSSDTRRYGGLGLGLVLVRRVAEGHGGAVECGSSAGTGTTFSVILQAAPAAHGERTAPGP